MESLSFMASDKQVHRRKREGWSVVWVEGGHFEQIPPFGTHWQFMEDAVVTSAIVVFQIKLRRILSV